MNSLFRQVIFYAILLFGLTACPNTSKINKRNTPQGLQEANTEDVETARIPAPQNIDDRVFKKETPSKDPGNDLSDGASSDPDEQDSSPKPPPKVDLHISEPSTGTQFARNEAVQIRFSNLNLSALPELRVTTSNGTLLLSQQASVESGALTFYADEHAASISSGAISVAIYEDGVTDPVIASSFKVDPTALLPASLMMRKDSYTYDDPVNPFVPIFDVDQLSPYDDTGQPLDLYFGLRQGPDSAFVIGQLDDSRKRSAKKIEFGAVDLGGAKAAGMRRFVIFHYKDSSKTSVNFVTQSKKISMISIGGDSGQSGDDDEDDDGGDSSGSSSGPKPKLRAKAPTSGASFAINETIALVYRNIDITSNPVLRITNGDGSLVDKVDITQVNGVAKFLLEDRQDRLIDEQLTASILIAGQSTPIVETSLRVRISKLLPNNFFAKKSTYTYGAANTIQAKASWEHLVFFNQDGTKRKVSIGLKSKAKINPIATLSASQHRTVKAFDLVDVNVSGLALDHDNIRFVIYADRPDGGVDILATSQTLDIQPQASAIRMSSAQFDITEPLRFKLINVSPIPETITIEKDDRSYSRTVKFPAQKPNGRFVFEPFHSGFYEFVPPGRYVLTTSTGIKSNSFRYTNTYKTALAAAKKRVRGGTIKLDKHLFEVDASNVVKEHVIFHVSEPAGGQLPGGVYPDFLDYRLVSEDKLSTIRGPWGGPFLSYAFGMEIRFDRTIKVDPSKKYRIVAFIDNRASKVTSELISFTTTAQGSAPNYKFSMKSGEYTTPASLRISWEKPTFDIRIERLTGLGRNDARFIRTYVNNGSILYNLDEDMVEGKYEVYAWLPGSIRHVIGTFSIKYPDDLIRQTVNFRIKKMPYDQRGFTAFPEQQQVGKGILQYEPLREESAIILRWAYMPSRHAMILVDTSTQQSRHSFSEVGRMLLTDRDDFKTMESGQVKIDLRTLSQGTYEIVIPGNKNMDYFVGRSPFVFEVMP